jgi:(1->4)-alpha-D-glucan 1-alpha-D-glucosylmutase
MSSVQIPSSTYRVQFNLNFRFADAEALVPYLHALGISHLYASPRFKARKGSSHGYDVADPMRINSELGTEEEFDRLARRLHQYGMGLLLDIVPNHMAASSENPWWMNVLENGRASRYADFFDIDWEPEGIKVSVIEKGRVILPILAAPYPETLLNQGIHLRFDDRGFFFQYEDNRLPLNPSTYSEVLQVCMDNAQEEQQISDASMSLLEDLQRISASLPQREDGGISFNDRDRTVEELKSALWQLHHNDDAVRRRMDNALSIFNGFPGDAQSFRALDSLLAMQPYRLAHWRLATKEINYRRFFDINDLVGLRIEEPLVFAARHAAIMRLVQEGKVSGLRVDHIDGLLDPLEYLERLKSIPVAGDHKNPDDLAIYTIVEKITSGEESLPAEWPCSGTTGYDFLNALNALFINPEGYRQLEESYRTFASIDKSFADTWYERKKQVIEELFMTDLDLLSHRLGRLAAADLYGKDVPVSELVLGLEEITASLPVYRTYYRSPALSPRDKPFLDLALSDAHRRAPSLSEDTFHFLRRVFLAELPFESDEIRVLWLSFILRWQQFTGAVMAKGLEDTALFAHHSLISVNEVGNNPFHDQIPFGVAAFHKFNSATLANYPQSLAATATHDTKWSEDVRARLNVLSEMPQEWAKCLRRWSRLNKHRKTRVDGRLVPTANEEVIFYQALLGIWPFSDFENVDRECLRSRLETFFIKAAKEAKTETNWLQPNEAHEAALRRFVLEIAGASPKDPFISDFLRMHQQIAFLGACNSYSQSILKMTAPGVPDFYQGSEAWNFCLTDPDNRRPIDFRIRQTALDELKSHNAHPSNDWLADLLRGWRDGRLKLYLTIRLLNFRREHPELFAHGDYLPLEVRGARSQSVFAFARHLGDEWLIVAVPRLLKRIATRADFPLPKTVWNATFLDIPSATPYSWNNILTGERIDLCGRGQRGTVSVSDLFRHFPFAVLARAEGNGQRS